MPDDALPSAPTLYERDFALWAEEQARALREGRVRDLDWDRLAEEVEGLGGSQRSEIQSRLKVLLAHLLKWEHQPAQRKYGWRATIAEQRASIETLIEASPSLGGHPEAVLAKAYRIARMRAAEETGIAERDFPETCPYPLDAVLDARFLPGPADPDIR